MRILDSENVEIQPGYHVYPFTFSLPRNIPSSFKTTHGNVTYTVKAVIDRPWKFDHIAIWNFDVETPFDLSEYGSATVCYKKDSFFFLNLIINLIYI